VATVLAAVIAIYAVSLCAVVALFASAVVRERSVSADGLRAVVDLAPSVAERRTTRTDTPRSAKSA
jgi:hypothetical protein